MQTVRLPNQWLLCLPWVFKASSLKQQRSWERLTIGLDGSFSFSWAVCGALATVRGREGRQSKLKRHQQKETDLFPLPHSCCEGIRAPSTLLPAPSWCLELPTPISGSCCHNQWGQGVGQGLQHKSTQPTWGPSPWTEWGLFWVDMKRNELSAHPSRVAGGNGSTWGRPTSCCSNGELINIPWRQPMAIGCKDSPWFIFAESQGTAVSSKGDGAAVNTHFQQATMAFLPDTKQSHSQSFL